MSAAPEFIPAVRLASPRRSWRSFMRGLHAATCIQWALLALIPLASGAVMLEVALPSSNELWSYVQNFLLAGAGLAVALRVVRTRTHGFFALACFYLGSLCALPFIWEHFFGNVLGWIAIACLAAAMAAPAYLTRKRWPVAGVALAIALTAVPPLGLIALGSPILAAGAFFPGWGIWAMLALIAFFLLSGVRSRWAVVLQIVAFGWGVAFTQLPPPQPPVTAWAATTYAGPAGGADLKTTFAKIDWAKHLTRQALKQGAKVIVLPEATDPDWSAGQKWYWRGIAEQARNADATVLVGVYTSALFHLNRIDGLADLTKGQLYPTMVAAPFSMWRPFRHRSFPLHLGAVTPIATVDGEAAYLVCYEALIAWPLTEQALHGVRFIVSAANLWYGSGWLLRPQARSAKIQARMWGLPLVRAVNYSRAGR